MTLDALEANGIRTAVRPGRIVITRILEPRETQTTMFGPTVDQAVTEILRRLELCPHEVTARQVGIEVDLCLAGTIRPVAVIQEGLKIAEVSEVLRRMTRP